VRAPIPPPLLCRWCETLDTVIAALSGAHTLGRCHMVRSGFDGPWTTNALRFDNEYYRNLMTLEWQPKQWDGPMQYEDVATTSLMMLPTDMALREDAAFAAHAQRYADDESAFFADFAAAFGKLLALGKPVTEDTAPTLQEQRSATFRECAPAATPSCRLNAGHGHAALLAGGWCTESSPRTLNSEYDTYSIIL
jgi:hypothetical protein